MREGEAPGRTTAPLRLTLAAAALGTLATLAVTFLPFLRFAYEMPRLHIVLETGNAGVALLVAYLAYGRYRLAGRARDLLLALALVVLSVANLPLTAVPSALDGLQESVAWAGITVRLLGTLLIAAAAYVPARRVLRPRDAARLAVGTGLVVLLAVGACLVAGAALPEPLDPTASLGDGAVPVVVGHPLLLLGQAVGVIAYALAAVSFTRQAGRVPDEFLRHLGAGCALAALSRVNYLLFPSLYSDYVYTGDLLRLAFYMLLLRGASREIASYWAARSEAAVLSDRRRMARDLHDGLAQELAYIWTQSRRLAREPADPELVERINAAAERALDESRRAIGALTRPLDEDIGDLLRRQVEDMARRYDVAVTVHSAPGVPVSREQAEALLRITGEAMRNAVRHGGASRVDVALAGPPLRLEIRDDGGGFDVTPTIGGFGLVSMRERAAGVGAQLALTSTPGQGTCVRVVWPDVGR